jgi:4-amino-4-deoxy-L-arabinose transferase-like glycosyltransferase
VRPVTFARFFSPSDFARRLQLVAFSEKANWAERRDPLIIVVVGLLVIHTAWVGYVGTDDQSYARGALGWLTGFPYVGNNHWELRHPVVIPLALSLGAFGYGEISLGLPSALFFLLLLLINYHYLHRFFGRQFALVTSLFMATTPLFAVYATFPQTVTVETLAMGLSFWLFYSATRTQECGWLMFASGIAAGFGFLVRETAGLLTLFYAILFVAGFGVPRRYYWVMLGGFILVVGTEILYLTAMTADPLYRYRIDLFHSGPPGSNLEGRSIHSTVDSAGNLRVESWVVRRLFVLLFNQEFGLLFWVFAPAAIWTCCSRCVPVEQKNLMRLLAGLALIWITGISFGSVLSPVPRFYTIAGWASIIIVVFWMRYCLYPYRSKVAASAAGLLLTANLFCMYVDNRDPAFAERALVKYVAQHRTLVYTDPTTLRYAKLLLEFEGVSEWVLSDPVPAGGLFYSNSKNIESCRRYGCPFPWEQYIPKEGWTAVMSNTPKPRLGGIILSSMGLGRMLPNDILQRIGNPNTGGILYLASPSSSY